MHHGTINNLIDNEVIFSSVEETEMSRSQDKSQQPACHNFEFLHLNVKKYINPIPFD